MCLQWSAESLVPVASLIYTEVWTQRQEIGHERIKDSLKIASEEIILFPKKTGMGTLTHNIFNRTTHSRVDLSYWQNEANLPSSFHTYHFTPSVM